MNYKPDEGMLMAYLYGELTATEAEKVQLYLQQHPEELKKLQGLGELRTVISHIQDQEVIAPPLFMNDANVKPLWQSNYFKTVMSIAASLLFLMVAGKFLGTEISYSNGELAINFSGKKEPIKEIVQPSLTEEKVKEMIQNSLASNNEVITANWTEDQKRLSQSIRQNLDQNSKKIDALMKGAADASQAQVRGFVASLQNENLKLMKDYFQLSTADQKKYTEGLLVDFSEYLKEQRRQDLMILQTRVNSIEKNTDQFKQETEQILASIISTPVGKSKNSY
ncbi:MAG: anti-sigma factor family protein [Cyclobacteriaceae bacterium]